MHTRVDDYNKIIEDELFKINIYKELDIMNYTDAIPINNIKYAIMLECKKVSAPQYLKTILSVIKKEINFRFKLDIYEYIGLYETLSKSLEVSLKKGLKEALDETLKPDRNIFTEIRDNIAD